MVRGSLANYAVLHRRLVLQHAAPAHKPYPWEYWPREEQRSENKMVIKLQIHNNDQT